ncbi:MAG: hypothetical protein LBK72_06590, partial [Bifidobacteriaceae bacterium]|nr:hypothetical protein [Bifidobacteriaceae bacterium]
DEAITEAARLAEAEATAKRAAAHDAEERYAAADPQTHQMRLDNARSLVDSTREDRESTRDELSQTSALLDDRAALGLYDKMEQAKAALDDAMARRDRLDRAAQAAKLLHETLHRHEDAAKAKYVAPFKNEVERLGRVVFGPGFTVEVSQDLMVVSRTMDGRTVPVESLSAGTREQLALIARLACAALVDPAEGAPVILDDTLGFADPARLRDLGTVLGTVGRQAQVVLLTCQPDRFANVGGATVVRLTRG